MTDGPADQLAAMNRVSIRAVLAAKGEDVTEALMRAGIINPVAIPVVLGDDAHAVGGLLGDGITPNLTGVLELDSDDAAGQPDEDGTRPISPPDRRRR